MRRRRLPKYFIKLMIISLFAGMIPIVAFAIYANFYFSKNVQHKVDELNVQNLSETMLRMEQLLTTIDYSLTLVANSDELYHVTEAAYESKYFQQFRALSAQLLRMQSVDMGILNVFFVHYDKSWVVSNRKVERLERHAWMNTFKQLQQASPTSGWMTAGAVDQLPSSLLEGNTIEEAARPAFVFLYKKTPLNSPNPIGILAVQISRTELERRINLNDEASAQLILDEGLNVIAGDAALLSQEQWSIALKSQVLADIAKKGSASIPLQPGTYGIVKQSAYNSWYYMSVHEASAMKKDANQIRQVTIGLSAIILIITITMSVLLNRGAYRPVQRLYDTMARYSNADHRNKDEFQFIGERIEALIDSSGNMKQQMMDQVQKLREFYLFKLLLGEVDASEADRQLAFYGIPANANRRIAVLVMTISNWNKSRYCAEDIDIMMFAIHNMIQELVPSEQRLELMMIGSDHVLIVHGEWHGEADHRAFREEMSRIAQKLQGEINQYLSLYLHIGVSRTYTSMGDLPRAYNEAVEAVKRRNILDGQSLGFHDELFTERNTVFVSPRKAEKEMILAVHANNLLQAREALRRIVRELLDSNVNFTESQLYMVRLLVNMLTESLQPGESMQLLSRDNKSIFEQLFRMNTIEEIEKWFDESVLQPLIQSRTGHEEQPSMRIVEQMVELIHTQYHSDLTLETCAEKLNFHSDYLRRIFRKGIGMNFSEYLAQYRLQVSMELLKQSEWTVSDIAQHLNYNNSQNFIRSFKKVMGMTPGQYREQMKLNKT